MTDDQGNCVRILACVGSEGRWFNGRSFGRGKGSLAGLINSGEVCTGTWTSRNRLGLGEANVSCDGGMEVTVLYTYQDEYTGTAIGRGITNDGQFVQAWSGLHVLKYLRDLNGSAIATLPCGGMNVPIS